MREGIAGNVVGMNSDEDGEQHGEAEHPVTKKTESMVESDIANGEAPDFAADDERELLDDER
jgi:hypothetical protein